MTTTTTCCLSAALLIGGWFLCIRFLYRAANAIEFVLERRKNAWIRLCCYSGLSCLGACLVATVPAYWLSVCTSC